MMPGATVDYRRARTSDCLSRFMYANSSAPIDAFNSEVRSHETSLRDKRRSMEPLRSRRVTMDARRRASYGPTTIQLENSSVSATQEMVVELEERYRKQIRDAIASRDQQIKALEARLRTAEAAVAEKDSMLLTLSRDILDKDRLLNSTTKELETTKRYLLTVTQRFNLRFGVDPFSGITGYFAPPDTPTGWPSSTAAEDHTGGSTCRSVVHSSLNDSAPSVVIPDEFDSVISDGVISAEENPHVRTVIKTKHRKNKESPHGLPDRGFRHRNWSKSQPATPASQSTMPTPTDAIDEAVRRLVEAFRCSGMAVPTVEKMPSSRQPGWQSYLIGGSIRAECKLAHNTVIAKLPSGRMASLREVLETTSSLQSSHAKEKKCPMKAASESAYGQMAERSKSDPFFTSCRDWVSRHVLRLPVSDIIKLVFSFHQNDDRQSAQELARRVLIRQEDILAEAGGRDLARFLSTLAALGIREHEPGMTDTFEAAMPSLVKHIGEMRSYQIIAVCGAYKKVGIFSNELAAALARRAVALTRDDNQNSAFRALLGIMGNLSVRIDRDSIDGLVEAAAEQELQGDKISFRLAGLLQICTKLGMEDHRLFYVMMDTVASDVDKWPATPTKPLVDTLNHLMLSLVCQHQPAALGNKLAALKEKLLRSVVEYLANSGVGPGELDTYCQINLCVIELHIRLERPLLWCGLSDRARVFLGEVSQLRVNNQYDALPTMSSQQHLVVSRELSQLGVDHTLEVSLQQPYMIDIVIANSRKLLEIDGPRHFINGTEKPTVSTELKHRLLTHLGYDKKAKLHEALMAEQSFYNFKEIEQIAKKCGIVPQSVKEVVQHLVDGDRLVTMEKVGSQNIYWALPSSQKATLIAKLEKNKSLLKSSEDALEEAKARKGELEKELEASGITQSSRGRQIVADSTFKFHQEKSAALRKEFEELDGKRRKLTSELEELEAADPKIIRKQIEEMRRSRDLVDIWTDNISTIRQFIASRGGMSEEDVDKEFGIDPSIFE
ncbi:Meiotic nuclear division protein 1 [Perkinsus chesapeaki]|uniref:Meiotic nuclear division protein 1 n=1 Tax=Perkinsus chesapeaki TaxID=330153 RepID=A0A7J6LAW4_PERCH|nr:Meiotic nuclear division protein 1 [Perkinsus chesapeaki]